MALRRFKTGPQAVAAIGVSLRARNPSHSDSSERVGRFDVGAWMEAASHRKRFDSKFAADVSETWCKPRELAGFGRLLAIRFPNKV
jgi:hypothetical protein